MAITAQNIVSKPLADLRVLIANCEAFQQWVGVDPEDVGQAAGITEALGFVHLVEMNEAESLSAAQRKVLRPLAVVSWGDLSGTADSEPCRYFEHEVRPTVIFEAIKSEGESIDTAVDEWLDFTNNVGAVIEEMMLKQGAGGLIHFSRYRRQFGPARMDEKDVAAGALELLQVSFEFTLTED